MAYKPTNWQDTLRDAQGNVIQKGTPLNAQALGKIEEGIVQTEQKIDTEIGKVTSQLAQTTTDLTQRMINIRQPPYNAKGDGSDETAIIQAALNTKQLIYFPYTSNGYGYTNLIIPLGTAGVCGQSMATSVSKLKHLGSSGKIGWNGSGRVVNAMFKDLYIEGNGSDGETCGLDLSGFSYCKFENLYIRSFKLDGIYGDGTTSPVLKQISNNTFIHCRFNNNLRDGLRLESSFLQNNENSANTFIGCEFGGNIGKGINEIVGESNHYVGCTAQGNGGGDIYLNSRASVFTGYVENIKPKSCVFGSSSKRCVMKVRSTFPLWNTFIDNGTLNEASIYGEKEVEKNLFNDPYFLRAVTSVPLGMTLYGTPIIAYHADNYSPFGFGMTVTVNANYQGFIFDVSESASYLSGKWATVIIEVDTSGVIETINTRVSARMDGVGSAINGEFVSENLPITNAGKYTTLCYDVRFPETVGTTPTILWNIGYSGVVGSNTLKIRSIHIIEGQTRKRSQYAGDLTKMISATTTAIQNATNAINTAHKYPGKIIYESSTGKMRFATASSPTSAWRAFDGTGDLIPI